MEVKTLNENISEVLKQIANIEAVTKQSENKLNELRLSNAKRLAELQIEQVNKVAAAKLAREQKLNERLIKMGFDAVQVVNKFSAEQMKEYLEKEKEAKLKNAKKIAKATGEDIDSIKKRITDEYAFRNKKAKEFNAAQEKERKKQQAAIASEAADVAKKALGGIGGLFGLNNKSAKEQVKEYLREQGVAESDLDKQANKALKDAKLAEAFNALASFAKELGSTTKEIGDAKSQIDTRLQGSSNNNKGFFGGGGSA